MIRRVLRTVLPPAVRSRAKNVIARARGLTNFYERVYDRQAAMMASDASVGGGDFELMGKIELGLLKLENVKPTDTVVDLGCGTGRLAVQLIPELKGGKYIGIDISRNMLRPHYDLPDASVDVICAFSVFTHMEAEDTYRYFVDSLRVARHGGKLIFSCLPVSLANSRPIFMQQASLDLEQRWAAVRNFVTTEETMETLARWAGWRVVRWYRGDESSVTVPGLAEKQALGQSTCVLQRP
ncbi:MAG: methyltransferase domain-containing protein [Deltaproteobacteria bacterium]|nr:MAG: methyltransferase domain-containing protein [Deltaproteobacteria bacterium]